MTWLGYAAVGFCVRDEQRTTVGATINSLEFGSSLLFGQAIACSMLKHSFWEKAALPFVPLVSAP
jgi:hypothetical protein